MIWYAFKPVDTLFFKSAAQAEKGQDHEALSIFPPTPHTIAGALRTTLLRQHEVSIEDYRKGNVSKELEEAVGRPGSLSPFEVTGPILEKNNELFLPTPYHWFVDKYSQNETVYTAKPVESDLLYFPSEKKYWVKGTDSELENVGGMWINFRNFLNPSRKYLCPNDNFFQDEIRTGNALSISKTVIEGHLYSFTHIRFNEDTRLLFAVNKNLPLAKEGILTLGGEQRFGNYRLTGNIELPKGNTGLYMSLTLLKADKNAQKALVATGKLIFRGGWDLHIGFHKPMEAYYPAGSVFDEKIDNNMIEL